jgi:hypothetical protein
MTARATSLRCSDVRCGSSLPKRASPAMSALPPLGTKWQTSPEVRFVPNPEVAAVHSINSSARESRVGGTVRSSSFAVFKFITNSNLVGTWTGNSPGLTPLRMRST